MELKEKLLGNNVVRLSDGRIMGTVTKIYLDEDHRGLEKIALNKNRFVNCKDIVFVGEDVVLINRINGTAPHTNSHALKKGPSGSDPAKSSMLCAANNISKEATGVNWWVHTNHE